MQLSGAHILIVDDEDGIRDLFKQTLEAEGGVCHTASDGAPALELLASEPMDLALVDITMPRMSGMVLFQHMKDGYPGVPVVFITAVDELTLAVEHLKKGAYDYIVKPVTKARLLGAVEDGLGRRQCALKDQEHRIYLEEQTAQQATQLEARMRELSSLNRMFQAELSNRFSAEHGTDQTTATSRARQLGRSITSVKESEKKRISDYLHGHVQSKLLVLQHRLAQCREIFSTEPDKASTLLKDIEADLTNVQEVDIRQVSHELYPSIARLGIVPALNSLRDRFWKALPVDIEIGPEIEQGNGHLNRKSFPEEFQIGVYRIVEEALDNVVKHSHATRAKIELCSREDGNISLAITDDGCGFETTRVSSFFGLLAMRDYAETLGGSCQITSVPEQFTRVNAILPDPRRAEAAQDDALVHSVSQPPRGLK